MLPVGLLELCFLTTSRSVSGWRLPTFRQHVRTYGTASAHTKYAPTIGLELHVQLKTHGKLFSRARTSYEAIPNTHVEPFDAALPGSLPVLDAQSVRLALLTALSLNCKIHLRSKFDRKHYFYNDLPAGFQITQKYAPLASHGYVQLSPRHDGLDTDVRVGVTQIQLEQDTAKSMHDPFGGRTLLDLNRAGTPLIEIISEPDMHSSDQAAAYVRKVQSIMKRIGASDADMEKGSMRIDVNVSVAPAGSTVHGTRCEIKNLNSIRSMVDAIEHETERQSALLVAGQSVEQQTRSFDASTGTTATLRSKSDAPDYRYMPDPELAPLILQAETIEALHLQLPLLPDQIRTRLEEKYDLKPREVDILVRMSDAAEDEGLSGLSFFERVAHGRSARMAANWVLHDLLSHFTKHEVSFANCPVSPEELGSLIDAIGRDGITSTVAKQLLAAQFNPNNSETLTEMIQKATSLAAQTAIDYEALAAQVVLSLPKEAEKVRKGSKNVMAPLIGEGMKRSKGQANPSKLNASLLSILGSA